MKSLILILSTCLLFSCGKSVYYAYDFSNELNDYYSYCTLEVTRKKEIIYRASSYKYHHIYPDDNLYVYIYSDEGAAEVSENYYRFGSTMSDLWTIEDPTNPKMERNLLYFDSNDHFDNKYYSSVSYRIEKQDTIVCITDDFDYLKKGHGFKESGVL